MVFTAWQYPPARSSIGNDAESAIGAHFLSGMPVGIGGFHPESLVALLKPPHHAKRSNPQSAAEPTTALRASNDHTTDRVPADFH